MSIPRPIVDEIRARTDIVAVVGQVVTLKRQGRSWVGLCPFHTDRKPSFHVVPDKGIFHCFPCGAGGDVFSFLMKARGLSFVEAVKELAGPAGVPIEEREISPEERQRLAVKQDLYGVVEESCAFLHTLLLTAPEGAPGRAYLEQRGISLDTAIAYRLGYAPAAWDTLAGNLQRKRVPAALAIQAGVLKRSERTGGAYDVFRDRLVFPILDDRGRPVAFGGRILPAQPGRAAKDEGPKYLNSPESPIYDKSRTLYGLSWGRTAIQRKGRVILVEGYFDAVSLWQAGFQEAVATCGTALTPHHAEQIRRLANTAIALFDGDEAGQRAATRSMGLFLDAGVEARRLDLGDAKDPDEFVQKHGAEAFEALLGRTEPLLELVVRRAVESEPPTPEGRARALRALVPTLQRLPDLVRGQMVTRAAGLLGLREEAVLDALRSAPAPATRASEAAPEPRPQAAERWVPTRELSHALWLLVHHTALTAPLLAEADPDEICERREVLAAIVRIGEGTPLPEVLADSPPDVARVLQAVAAREELYTAEQAAPAMASILAKLALPRLEARVAALSRDIDRADTADPTRYRALVHEVAALHARRRDLLARTRRGGGP
jgi:DNA primase